MKLWKSTEGTPNSEPEVLASILRSTAYGMISRETFQSNSLASPTYKMKN